MARPDETNPGGKAGQRQRKQKPDKQATQKPERQQDEQEQINAAVASDIPSAGPAASSGASAIGAAASNDISPIDAAGPADISPSGAVGSSDSSSIGAVAKADIPPIGFQTIATAYSDYIRKSYEQTRSFVEKLSGVRSLDKAIEIQSEFAKQAYETFVAESQRIRGLYSELAKQSLKPLDGYVAKVS